MSQMNYTFVGPEIGKLEDEWPVFIFDLRCISFQLVSAWMGALSMRTSRANRGVAEGGSRMRSFEFQGVYVNRQYLHWK